MKQNFVTFYSPGTFVPEQTTLPIDTWDTDAAMTMARNIKERHGATPYAFQFSTRKRSDADLDSKESERSCTYYLGGTVLTLKDIKARNDPKDEILISNMRGNGIKRVLQNDNSWRTVCALYDRDVVLEFTP